MPLFSNIIRLPALDVAGRRVFLRADLNVPLSGFGGVIDDTLLRAALPTIRALLAADAKVVIGAHYGSEGALAPRAAQHAVARRLSELLGQSVLALGTSFEGEVALLRARDVALTPNLLELPEELANDAAFAQRVARHFDAHVNDDLRASSQRWASLDALPRALPVRGVGAILGADLDALDLLSEHAIERPFVAVVGGDSVVRKSKLLWALLERADALLLGGALANACLKAQGVSIGASACDAQEQQAARALLDGARERGVQIYLPQDVLVMDPEVGLASLELRLVADVRPADVIVDVALETCLLYADVLARSASVLYTGLLGTCTATELQSGTFRVAQAATTARRSMAFGDRTVRMLELLNLVTGFSIVSRSGTAAAPLMSGTVLPGIESARSYAP